MGITAPANVHEVFELLRGDLAAIEQEFERGTVASVPAITEIGAYLRNGGGKRIRPAMLLLASRLLHHEGEGARRIGAVIEIIHTATLVHDDIIDDARTRRGRPSANTLWGNARCVLAGDWLYMQAFKLSVRERNFRILDLLIDLTQQMVEGELLQAESLGRLVGVEEYNDLIYRKTACLFSTGMRLGAVLASAPEEQETLLAGYGHDVGMAYQIVDDVLDLTASEERLGKPVASDLREGKATLPVLYALEHCTAAERGKIEQVLAERAFAGVTHAEIMEILEKYGAVERALAEAERYAEKALQALKNFEPCDARQSLEWIAGFVVSRDR